MMTFMRNKIVIKLNNSNWDKTKKNQVMTVIALGFFHFFFDEQGNQVRLNNKFGSF